MRLVVELVYIGAALLLVLGLKRMSVPAAARRGNGLSAAGMLLAVAVTLFHPDIRGYRWILSGLLLGSAAGFLAARRTAMTAMPGMVSLLNGSGGLASLLVAWAEYQARPGAGSFTASTMALSALIGGPTFSGSVLAWAKLGEKFAGRPVRFAGQHWLNGVLLLACLLLGLVFSLHPARGGAVFATVAILSLALGVLIVLPIGGADMPVVVSLLNSCSGLAACATGFVLGNNILIVAGSLVGSSGIVLTRIMCRAMNRSLANVLFSGFGAAAGGAAAGAGRVRSLNVRDAAVLLEAAGSVVIIPGYGMAVAQAQHALRELGDWLETNGARVRYAVHPVAGRMPGHMDVLLAEADVPCDQLVDLHDVNPTLPGVDVCLVVGANDIVNPAAREDNTSPLYGMPILDADRARAVIVLKRSLASGFAGIENRLFEKDNCRLLFGDAKTSLTDLVAELKATEPWSALAQAGR